MSIIGSFVGALMALGFRAKPEENQREIVRLEIDLADARREIQRLQIDLAGWRDEALRLRHNEPLPLGGQHAVNDWRQLGQAAQNVMHQQQQQMAACQGLQQSQYVNMPDGWYCDCSPSRSRALIRDCPGA